MGGTHNICLGVPWLGCIFWSSREQKGGVRNMELDYDVLKYQWRTVQLLQLKPTGECIIFYFLYWGWIIELHIECMKAVLGTPHTPAWIEVAIHEQEQILFNTHERKPQKLLHHSVPLVPEAAQCLHCLELSSVWDNRPSFVLVNFPNHPKIRWCI